MEVAVGIFGALDEVGIDNGFIVFSGWLAVPATEPWPDTVFVQCGERRIE
jgi:hypothetical protein